MRAKNASSSCTYSSLGDFFLSIMYAYQATNVSTAGYSPVFVPHTVCNTRQTKPVRASPLTHSGLRDGRVISAREICGMKCFDLVARE